MCAEFLIELCCFAHCKCDIVIISVIVAEFRVFFVTTLVISFLHDFLHVSCGFSE